MSLGRDQPLDAGDDGRASARASARAVIAKAVRALSGPRARAASRWLSTNTENLLKVARMAGLDLEALRLELRGIRDRRGRARLAERIAREP